MKSRLFLRFYAALVIALLVAFFTSHALNRSNNRGTLNNLGVLATGALRHDIAIGRTPQESLASIDELMELQFSAYDAKGRLLTSRLANPTQQLSTTELAAPTQGHTLTAAAEILFHLETDIGNVRYLATGHPHAVARADAVRLLAVFGIPAVILAIAAFGLQRRHVRPFARIVATVRRFGSGDLKARVELKEGGEIGELARAIDDMGEQISELLAAQRRVLSNASHELRTPLTRLRLAVEAAQEHPELLRQDQAGIENDFSRLEELVESILASARVDAAVGEGPESCDVVAALQALTLDHASLIDLELPRGPLRVAVRPAAFKSITENLLSNAIKFGNDTQVQLSVQTEQDNMVLRARDHGPGIAANDTQHLFERFYRGAQARANNTAGAGLGLAIVAELVRAAQGTAQVVQHDGPGALIEVRLPLEH